MIWLTLLITVIITTLIVLVYKWILNQKSKHPQVYEQRHFFRFVVWVVLNSTQA